MRACDVLGMIVPFTFLSDAMESVRSNVVTGARTAVEVLASDLRREESAAQIGFFDSKDHVVEAQPPCFVAPNRQTTITPEGEQVLVQRAAKFV